MIWAPDLDDFSGQFCKQGSYPLMKTVVNLVQTGVIVPIIVPTAPTVTSAPWTATTDATLPTSHVELPSSQGKLRPSFQSSLNCNF